MARTSDPRTDSRGMSCSSPSAYSETPTPDQSFSGPHVSQFFQYEPAATSEYMAEDTCIIPADEFSTTYPLRPKKRNWCYMPFFNEKNPINGGMVADDKNPSKAFDKGQHVFRSVFKITDNLVKWTRELIDFLNERPSSPLSWKQIQTIVLRYIKKESHIALIEGTDPENVLIEYQRYLYSIEEKARDYK